jgi:hypothetical protein
LALISKRRGADRVTTNLDDYDHVRAGFTWAAARAARSGRRWVSRTGSYSTGGRRGASAQEGTVGSVERH